MTQQELESYVTRLLPEVRKRFIQTDDDEDHCQQAIIDLFKKADKLDIPNDNEFIMLFKSFYYTLKWRARTAEADRYRRGYSTQSINFLEYETILDGDDRPYPYSYSYEAPQTDNQRSHNRQVPIHITELPYLDPWDNPRVQALEFIECLPDNLQTIFYLYYIEGHTLQEVADLLGYGKSRIGELLTEGINYLKKEMKKEQ